jgi:hypothetical protein
MLKEREKLKEKPMVKLADILIILLAAGLTVFSAYAAYMKPQNSSRVVIRGQEREWIFPLDTEETIVVPGPLGDTIVKIHDDRAWVESSPCQNQTCVASGHVRRQGSWAACLPNNVLLIIEGNDDNDVDIIVW